MDFKSFFIALKDNGNTGGLFVAAILGFLFAVIFWKLALWLIGFERWTPSFGPLSAENKMDSRGLLSWLFLFVCRSLCASNPFGKERTSRAWHGPSSLSLLIGCQYLPPQAV